MAQRLSVICDGCGVEGPTERFRIRNRHGTEWFMDYCPDCAWPLERGKGVNLPRSTRYQRFKVTHLPPQPKRK